MFSGTHPVSSCIGGKNKIKLFYPKFKCYCACLLTDIPSKGYKILCVRINYEDPWIKI